MAKIFVEYKILESKRAQYLAFMQEMLKKQPELEWFEGTDQAGLFIEIWNNMNYEAYCIFKEERLYSECIWRRVDPFVCGGKEKIHLWHFTALN
jgi:hypothetical protein